MASATRCNSFRRIAAPMSRQALKAMAAAVAALSMSSVLPRATFASTAPSIGDRVSNLAPEIDGTLSPPIICEMPSAFSFASRGAARSRLVRNKSDFGVTLLGVTLSMGGLCLQSLMDVVALPTGLLVVDLHVERQSEFAFCKHRIEIRRQRAQDVFAGGLAGLQVAAFAEPQHHVEEGKVGIAVADRVMLASHRAHADAAERKDAGLDCSLANDFHHVSPVDACVEIGGIFDGEMRHGGAAPLGGFRSGE